MLKIFITGGYIHKNIKGSKFAIDAVKARDIQMSNKHIYAYESTNYTRDEWKEIKRFLAEEFGFSQRRMKIIEAETVYEEFASCIFEVGNHRYSFDGDGLEIIY